MLNERRRKFNLLLDIKFLIKVLAILLSSTNLFIPQNLGLIFKNLNLSQSLRRWCHYHLLQVQLLQLLLFQIFIYILLNIYLGESLTPLLKIQGIYFIYAFLCFWFIFIQFIYWAIPSISVFILYFYTNWRNTLFIKFTFWFNPWWY